MSSRSGSPRPTPATGDPDQLALDDRAWAIVPPTRERVILVVGDGDPYLETALSKLPNVDLWLGTPADYARNPDNPEGKPWDLVIFEGAVPSELPDVPILAIAPDRTSALGTVNGSLTNPGIGSLNPDEPILSFVDLSTLHVAEAARMTLPDWARAVIPGPSGAPLLYAGQRDGLPTAVLAFDPRQSDLPLQVAFPILLANLTGELLGGSSTPVDPIRPGDPVELTIRPGTTALRVTAPDGAVQELVPGTDDSSSVTYSGTALPGVYTVTPILDPAASPAPSGTTPRPTVRPESSPSASGAPAAAGDDSSGTNSFVVGLFDVHESTITPGDGRGLVQLGAAPGGEPGASPGTAGGPAVAEPRPTTRDELWIPIVLLVLVALCVEWAVYHRDALARIRRGFAARLGRAPGGSA